MCVITSTLIGAGATASAAAATSAAISTAVAVAGTAASIAASVTQAQAQQEAANTSAKFQQQQYNSTAAIASENYTRTLAQLSNRDIQETDVASGQVLDNQQQARAAQGSAIVGAGEAGVEGNSVNTLLADFSRIEALNNANIGTNLQWSREQRHEDALSARANALSQISSARPAPVHGPNLLASALEIGGTALDGFDRIQQKAMSGPYDVTKRNKLF
jgi:hypothetical protein